MVEVIGVRFSNAGKIYYFDPKGEKISVGTRILVETARGVEMGHVVMPNSEVDDSEIVPPLKPIIRIADEDDFARLKENKEKEKEAFIIANEKIAEHGINMKLVDVEYTFDRSKILFYFTADGRVDFRELVKSLAGIFHTRIELRQIGVRDEARQLGSFGICGRYVCCGTFLDDFKPVSIKMAKEQGLSLNPTKISGICGRLMCCLQYEQNVYDEMLKKLPNKGSLIDTPDGKGLVVDVATLKGEVKVKFDSGDAVRFANYKVADINSDEVRVTKAESTEDTAVPDLPEEKIEDENIEAPHRSRPKRRRDKRGRGKRTDGEGRNNKNEGKEAQSFSGSGRGDKGDAAGRNERRSKAERYAGRGRNDRGARNSRGDEKTNTPIIHLSADDPDAV